MMPTREAREKKNGEYKEYTGPHIRIFHVLLNVRFFPLAKEIWMIIFSPMSWYAPAVLSRERRS